MEYSVIDKPQSIHMPKEEEHPVILEILSQYTLVLRWILVYDQTDFCIRI